MTITVKEVQENDLNLLLMALFYGFHDDFVDFVVISMASSSS